MIKNPNNNMANSDKKNTEKKKFPTPFISLSSASPVLPLSSDRAGRINFKIHSLALQPSLHDVRYSGSAVRNQN